MILLFNNIPVTESYKIEKMVEKAKTLYASEFYNVEGFKFLGDDLTIESLFPNWIIKKYETNPSDVLVVPIIKNYLRWLLSIDQGYGAQLEWENLRVPIYCNSIFLEAVAEYYFPNADFSQEPLASIRKNIRKFALKAKEEFTNKKGTKDSIKYLLVTLLGISVTDVFVHTSSPGFITIEVDSSEYYNLLSFDSFLREYVFSAGSVIVYRSV